MAALAILFGCLFTAAVSIRLGALLLGDAAKDAGLRFVAGAALLSLLVFCLCAAGLVSAPAFASTGAAHTVAINNARSGFKSTVSCRWRMSRRQQIACERSIAPLTTSRDQSPIGF